MEYIAPSKEFIEESKGDSVNDRKILDDYYESDKTNVIDARSPILSKHNSTASYAECQTELDKSTGTSPSKISF